MSEMATQTELSPGRLSDDEHISAAPENRDPPSKRVATTYHLSLLMLSAAVLVAAVMLEVTDERRVRLPIFGVVLPEACYWRIVTGVNCPGCGLTRCFISLAHGDFQRALAFNAVGVALFCGVVFQVPFRGWQLWRISRGRHEMDLTVISFVFIALAAALIIQWIMRVVL